jgi:nucleoside 2-deoxyribosyltransferase
MMKVTISGSFRKFYPGIRRTMEIFTESGWEVLSPPYSEVINPNEEFIRFRSDPVKLSDRQLLGRHLQAIKDCDLFYVFNPGGYIGVSTAAEIGFALALGKNPIFLEKERDVLLQPIESLVFKPGELVRRIKRMITSPPIVQDNQKILAKINHQPFFI